MARIVEARVKKSEEASLDPLLAETLLDDVEPFLETWKERIVDEYAAEWQKYVDWAEDFGEVGQGDKSPVSGRFYGYRGLPWVKDYLEIAVFGRRLRDRRVAKRHSLGRWVGSDFKAVDEMRPAFREIADDFADRAKSRLLSAVEKYLPEREEAAVTDVEHAKLVERGGTLEGVWDVTYSDGSVKRLKTKMIWAGGYNIQRLHTRYLVHVSGAGVSAKENVDRTALGERDVRARSFSSAEVDALVERLADAFFTERIASDPDWTAELAGVSGSGRESQRAFYSGPPGFDGDVFEAYEDWVRETDAVEPEDERVALSLVDQVLFSASKRVGTFEMVSHKASVEIAEVATSTAQALADAYGARRVGTVEGRTTFYFNSAAAAAAFSADVASAEDVSESHRATFASRG